MSWCKPIALMILATAMVRCGSRGTAPARVVAERSPLFDSTSYAAVSARLRDAFVAHDSVYCDSVLPLFDDTALARAHPDRVTDGFVSRLIIHDAPSPAVIARFDALVRYSGAPVMRNWRDYVMARALQDNGSPRKAVAMFEPLLRHFQEDGDTVGIASVSKRIGNLYLELGEPAMAATHLERARMFEPRVDLRSTITATLGRCYALTGNADLVRRCAARLELDATDALNAQRGDQRAITNARWLRHLASLLATGSDSLQLAMKEAAAVDAFISAHDKGDGFLVATEPAAWAETLVLRAKVLLRLGRVHEAVAMLASIEEVLGHCVDPLPQRIAYLSVKSDALAASGNLRAALASQQERAEALALNKVGRERLAVEQAWAEAVRMQQEAEAALTLETERTTSRAMDREHRMQRVALVMMIGFVALFGAVIFARARLNRRIQLEQVRTRLSRDLHDDIGATLSSINILSSVAQRKAEAGDEAGAAASLTGISERTQRLMRNMSDIVWSVDPDRDTMEELLVRMREFGAAVLEPKDIRYRFESSGDLRASVPPLVKSNLYLIFKEAMNNAAKHAEATEVTVCLKHETPGLRMTITDNGKGLSLAKNGSGYPGGNGLRNMRARAAEMKAEFTVANAQPHGTSIELVVPL